MLLHPPVWADCVSQKLWVYVWGSSQLWPAKSPRVRCSQLWGKPCWRVGMRRCTENPSWGAGSYLVLFFIARSLYCLLCSSQAVPSGLGNRVSITGYTCWRVHHRRACLWGTVFCEQRSPLLPLALTAPRRRGSCKAMAASCTASQSPWSPGSQGDFTWLSSAQARWKAPAGEATWPQALPSVGGAVGAEGRGRAGGVSVLSGERLVRRLRGEEEGTGLWGGTEKVSSPFPGMEGGDQTGTMWRPKLSPCSFMWFPW